MINSNSRIDSIDFIKGICIFLVVWAHSIQNMGADDTFWENPVHIFICSFHMPIFMLISGYFFSSSIHQNTVNVVTKKFVHLIVPCIGWSMVLVLLQSFQMLYNGDSISIYMQIKQLLYESGTRFWFLRSVFICSILALFSMKIFKNDICACIITLVLFLLISDNFRLAMDKFMYPYFWMGYFIHKHTALIYKNIISISIFSIFVFVLLLFFWRKENYIYQTGMSFYTLENGHFLLYSISERLKIVVFRYLVGFFGSLFFFIILQRLYSSRYPLCIIFKDLGQYTLGVYVIHILIEGFLLKHFDLSFMSFLTFNFVITPVISVLLIAFCLLLIKLLQKHKFTSLLFLGKKPPKDEESNLIK